MSMNRLMSAAYAAGYAMAAEDTADTRAELARAPSNAIIVRPTAHRGVIANAQRSLRRLWLRAWSADHWGHHRAAA
jgi:hypothetical protein